MGSKRLGKAAPTSSISLQTYSTTFHFAGTTGMLSRTVLWASNRWTTSWSLSLLPTLQMGVWTSPVEPPLHHRPWVLPHATRCLAAVGPSTWTA